MSASPSIDAYDAQMLDFPLDLDVPMNITNPVEFFAEALMDHDGHLATSAYSEHPSVEVDMEEYVGDNAEYEMADETAEYQRPLEDELLDIEVYDASHAPSPLVPPQPLQSSPDVPIDSEHPETMSPTFSEHASLPKFQGESESEVHPAPLDHPAVDVSHGEPSTPGEVVSFGTVVSELARPPDAPDESVLVSESHEQLGDTNGQPLGAAAPADAVDVAVPPVAGEHVADSEVVQQENSELPTAESALSEDDGTSTPVQDENAADRAPATEEETIDPLHISDGVYIDPPPAVLLSVANLSESGFAWFALFNTPDVEGDSTEESPSNEKVHSLLLENRPTLYYEPLSSVFEALRQDERLLSRVPHSFEGELMLDAYDLQLAVSEDDVHSREISLHDLNILHDGSDFVGPLRLLLRAIVPRFIIRYYALQEQIQRLQVSGDTGEGERDEENHEHHDTTKEQSLPQREEAVNHLFTVVSDDLEVPPSTEDFDKELPPEPSEEVRQEDHEPEDTSPAQETSAEYRELAGEGLEDENDYEGTNVGDEDESTKPDNLDADQVHDTVAEDIDAPATVTGQGSEFGGEQTEYLDYAQLEEYDERYGEDFPEPAGGASPVQYDQPPLYEDEGGQDTSTAVDVTQVVLLGSEENEEDESTATPIPAHSILEPESSDAPAEGNAVLPTRDHLASDNKEPGASESTNEVDNLAQVSSNLESSTDQARIFSEVEVSDSNFVSMLEREADAEFERTFDAEQNGQEGSMTRQPIETWDEDQWDDEDAEGDNEEDWIDPDAESNESSVTLSSKASSKRSYDEVDPSGEPYVENPEQSPGLKRPRVQ